MLASDKDKSTTQRCCICGEKFEGFGNNPFPVKTEGVCCNDCNNLVVSARIMGIKDNEEYKQTITDSLCFYITEKLKQEIYAANEKSGVVGVRKVLKKYKLEHLLDELDA